MWKSTSLASVSQTSTKRTDGPSSSLAPQRDRLRAALPVHCTAHAGLRRCTKAAVPSMPSGPCSARENTSAASSTRSAPVVNRALATRRLVCAIASGAPILAAVGHRDGADAFVLRVEVLFLLALLLPHHPRLGQGFTRRHQRHAVGDRAQPVEFGQKLFLVEPA